MEDELSGIIVKICDLIAREDMAIQIKLRELRHTADSLEKLAYQAEYKIKASQINVIRKAVKKIVKDSTNRLVLASLLKILPGDN